MYCKNCGQRISDQVKVCPYCGYKIAKEIIIKEDDSGSIGWGLLGFLIPIAGLILYLVWKDNKPKCAKRARKGALASVICAVVVWVIYFVIIFGILGVL